MNILFICIDCLRDDHVSTKHADTPFIDSLSQEGKHFRNMHSTTTTTTPSVASFMTGFYSERNGINSLREAELKGSIKTLAEKFSEKGYNTYAEVSGPLVEETELDRGFDEYNYRNNGEDLFSDWKEELHQNIEKTDDPFFFFLHLWEIHTPVEVPEEFDKPKYGKTPYARALSALDREIEELVEKTPDDTAIIIHGDHGESISWRTNPIQDNLKKSRTLFRHLYGIDTRKAERILNRGVEKIFPGEYRDRFLEAGHGENIYDFATNVPFIVHSPEVDSEEINRQVRQIDVFPTILDLAEIDYKDQIDGESLLQEQIEDRKAYMRACGTSLQGKKNWSRGIRLNGWKYIEYPNRDWKPELYNLEKDPNELRDVKDKEKRKEMKEELPDKELLKSKEIEIKDKLEELGYL
jgi:arylsulfatase A-like enzyme